MEEGQLGATSLPLKTRYSEVTVSVTGEPPSVVEEEETAKEADIDTIPEVIEPLSILDMLRISAVLEDTTDQLSILNYIMPVQYERRQSTLTKKNNEMNLEEKSLEKSPVVSKTSKITSAFLPKEEPKLPEIRQGGQFANGFNKMQDFVFQKPTKQTITSTETLKKIQMDREENGRKQIKYLQKQLLNVKRERQVEVQRQNEYIAHLKDQLQELKAKTNMENHYMKRNAEVQISQTQKKCNKTEELLLEEIEKLRLKTEEENQIHMAIEIFLRKEQQQKLEEKLEFWMEKFDKDTEMKQNELNALKSAKASDLAHLQDLARMIREYEQVIIEDRMEKEKNRKNVEQALLELKSIIKLQAWWRGTIVRNEIGSFSMPKKDKDDGKDSKGKDKDKRRGKK
ncbi:dynein regulatory complex protein 9 isoform X4 [Phyllostomus discolor]|uniref:Dynein regulatory complex protein 9 n=1 Tax=Phyllostomus discolor TaxID=89673 RepID=A0A7E6D4G6_9CHIR|nr:dynein regulatory complex protein 9 isoform X4 [Phyllostomus discolor]